MSDRLVWIDCEMTGLNLVRDALIEIAALVTDSELNVLGDGVDVVIRPPDAALHQMVPVVREMHTNSGLLDELNAGATLAEAETAVLDYVQVWVPDAGKVPLAGNTVATDRSFIARDMAGLDRHLHYRIVDVSSLKVLAQRWYGPSAVFDKPKSTKGEHDAVVDVHNSIAELRHYRRTLFQDPPHVE